MKKALTLAALAAALLALGAASASAQTLERNGDFSAFDAINVTGPFEVNFVPSEKYAVKFVVEAVLADFVIYTQRENAVYVTYSDKDVPKEVKKIFRPEFINRIDEIEVFHMLSDDELQEIRMSREAERQRHTYSLDPDVDEWLRQQKDVGRVLNCALRLLMEQEKERKRMKKAK